MEVSFKKRFIKDLNKLPNSYKDAIEKIVFEEVANATELEGVRNIVHISGTENFYRIRKGDYRIGFKSVGGKVIFYRVLHRKEIYKNFP
tara:strand:+ start:136 stop:402 length:267 start_codon:yes stop_codon:yes gene_type:complete